MLLQIWLLLGILTFTQAQSSTAELNLTTALSQYDELTVFSEIVAKYPAIFTQLALGNVTLLAPTNTAIASYLNATSGTSNDSVSWPHALLAYHLIAGSHNMVALRHSPQFLPTMLTDFDSSNVTGGQRVEAQSSGDQVYFLSALKARSNIVKGDILFLGTAKTSSGVIHIIDSVLQIPVSFGATITGGQLAGLAQLISTFPVYPKIIDALANESDWMMFGANSCQYDQSRMSSQAIYDLEAYHWVQGNVKYSTDLTNGLVLRTFQGSDVTITVINGTIYVNAAKVIDSDYLMAKGVIHLIDSALIPNDTSARPMVTSAPNGTASLNPSSSPSSGLSTGAKAGIGVGAALGVIVLIGVAFFLIRRRKQPAKHKGIQELDSREKAGLSEILGRQKSRRTPEELESTERSTIHEMDSNQR